MVRRRRPAAAAVAAAVAAASGRWWQRQAAGGSSSSSGKRARRMLGFGSFSASVSESGPSATQLDQPMGGMRECGAPLLYASELETSASMVTRSTPYFFDQPRHRTGCREAPCIAAHGTAPTAKPGNVCSKDGLRRRRSRSASRPSSLRRVAVSICCSLALSALWRSLRRRQSCCARTWSASSTTGCACPTRLSSASLQVCSRPFRLSYTRSMSHEHHALDRAVAESRASVALNGLRCLSSHLCPRHRR